MIRHRSDLKYSWLASELASASRHGDEAALPSGAHPFNMRCKFPWKIYFSFFDRDQIVCARCASVGGSPQEEKEDGGKSTLACRRQDEEQQQRKNK